MPTRGARFAGMSVAIVTPFRNGAVDYAELDRLVDWHVEQGTDGLVPCGTTGESPTLDHESTSASSPPCASGRPGGSRSSPAPAPTARPRRSG